VDGKIGAGMPILPKSLSRQAKAIGCKIAHPVRWASSDELYL